MTGVDLHEVLRDTLVPWPELRRYGRWILLGIVVLVAGMAIEFPAALLAACAVGLAAAVLIRFVFCYARARDATRV